MFCIDGGFVCNSAFRYEGRVRDAIKNFKFSNVKRGAQVFDVWLSKVKNYSGKINCVCSVPMFENRQKERGYNQSEVLARSLAQILGLPFENVIKKTRDNLSQRGLGSDERKENVHDVFSVSSCVKGKSVLLVDDVVTTGATLFECLSLLCLAGAKAAEGLTLANVKLSK
ncbi:MAG: hypothetical protein LBP36_02720 [Oscillospiraceae bacterium]|nr:hypothetical protein [Oscillospiraceae bacterium]